MTRADLGERRAHRVGRREIQLDCADIALVRQPGLYRDRSPHPRGQRDRLVRGRRRFGLREADAVRIEERLRFAPRQRSGRRRRQDVACRIARRDGRAAASRASTARPLRLVPRVVPRAESDQGPDGAERALVLLKEGRAELGEEGMPRRIEGFGRAREEHRQLSVRPRERRDPDVGLAYPLGRLGKIEAERGDTEGRLVAEELDGAEESVLVRAPEVLDVERIADERRFADDLGELLAARGLGHCHADALRQVGEQRAVAARDRREAKTALGARARAREQCGCFDQLVDVPDRHGARLLEQRVPRGPR